MVSPQLENGYIRISTEVWQALCKIRIPGEARQVLDVIIRKTWGWNKKEDRISLSQFTDATGLKSDKVIRARAKLDTMNLISFKGNGTNTTYRFNKHFNTWNPLPKKETISQKGNRHIPKRKFSYPKKEDTIDNTDTITIDKEQNMCGLVPDPGDGLVEQAKEVIAYLNQATVSRYRPVGKNIQQVVTRLKEGFTVDDCKQVVDGQKLDPYFLEHPKYFRPSTLFGSKFESYLSAAPKNRAALELEPKQLIQDMRQEASIRKFVEGDDENSGQGRICDSHEAGRNGTGHEDDRGDSPRLLGSLRSVPTGSDQ